MWREVSGEGSECGGEFEWREVSGKEGECGGEFEWREVSMERGTMQGNKYGLLLQVSGKSNRDVL